MPPAATGIAEPVGDTSGCLIAVDPDGRGPVMRLRHDDDDVQDTCHATRRRRTEDRRRLFANFSETAGPTAAAWRVRQRPDEARSPQWGSQGPTSAESELRQFCFSVP